ncbi:MAG: hypothetical protein KAJ19_20100 [Gammaproteobacteria bacterium]|nr:hypothetical protein [Gammaproteobacteria bacterium]
MPLEYKILYTNGTSLLWSNIAPNGDPRHIPPAKRIGVHSILQGIENNTVRENIENYHYVYQISTERWIGLGLDGFIDWTTNLFEDIRCCLLGRTGATDTTFWDIKQKGRTDTDIVGSISEARAEATKFNAILGYGQGQHDQNSGDAWVDWARHRMYDERYAERPVYGFQEHYH